MSNIVDDTIKKVERLISQQIPLPSCPSDKPRAEQLRKEVIEKIYNKTFQTKPLPGPQVLK